MINVLFISLGNICRSPMAEAIFRKRIEEAGLSGLVTVDSAGIGHWHEGKEMHPSARELLGQKGISIINHQAKQIQAEHLEAYDYIIVMDQLNLQDISAIALLIRRVISFSQILFQSVLERISRIRSLLIILKLCMRCSRLGVWNCARQ
ncbi:hypothetical protein CHH49_13655 [Terribacillus saccharophilus]|uniref:low molecular weight protein-tyrosine-phosphatase n=1 Tax=Terribacillus saccharophilus TaxID=361277 RepID=UPI000BA566BF|nr:low molecular weight protein-tyrosine-phosphatase [Terribacillus saccharophilus]PAF21083.1 hypothetical protein CHH49_13655 [Terribacillus saccharophilus]